MSKWQPAMLILVNEKHPEKEIRLECDCGALAIFVVLTINAPQDFSYFAYCQPCWVAMQEEDEA